MSNLKPEHELILKNLVELAHQGRLEGRFDDIPIEVHHHPECPGVSSTFAKNMVLRTPNHKSKFVDKALIFGSAFHCFANEPHLFKQTYLNNPHLALGAEDLRCIEAMNKKLKSHPDVMPLYENCSHEHTFFARDPKTGILMKARPDGYQDSTGIIWDIKTTQNASRSSFSFDAKKYLYRISAAWYLRVISLVQGFQHNDFYLIPCEKLDPYEVAVYRVDQSSISRANEEIDSVLEKIANPGGWMGYPLGVTDLAI